MSTLRFALTLMAAAVTALPMTAQQKRVSPHETISVVIGERGHGNRITITYGRPYTKDPHSGEPRKIWGGLVPWGEPYRLGADEATLMTNQKPIVMGSLLIPAGAHTLYLIPSENGTSKLGISNDVGAWGEPVNDKDDLGRVDAKKETLDAPVDQLTLALDKDASGGGTVRIDWETTQFSIPFSSPGPHIDFPAASPTATFRQKVGVTDVEIVYSRPSIKGRAIFGGLVPWNEVWRTGANSATRISFSTPVTIQGTHLDAGTYEVFSIPGEDEWTVIFQKPTKQWGAYTYKKDNDVARVTAKPVAVAVPVESFSIGLAELRDESATLYLTWDRVRVPLKLEVDVKAAVVPQVEAVMNGPAKNKPYAQAAMFYGDHDIDLKKAADWMDTAIAANPDAYYLMYHKAIILGKMGDKEGAIAEAKKSIDLASKDKEPEKSEYIRLNEALIASLK